MLIRLVHCGGQSCHGPASILERGWDSRGSAGAARTGQRDTHGPTRHPRTGQRDTRDTRDQHKQSASLLPANISDLFFLPTATTTRLPRGCQESLHIILHALLVIHPHSVTMSRQGRNSIADMGLANVRALVNDTRNRRSRPGNNGMGCLLFTGSVNTDGYGQVSGKAVLANNKDHMYSLHRLAAAAVTGVDIPAGLHASHLCDVRRCFHLAHIVVESIAANNGRKGCLGSIVCRDHGHVLWACSHQPACIRVPTAVQTCCLKVEQARRAGNTVDAGQQMSQPDVDDFTAAALAAENRPIDDAIRTYADVVRARSASRQSSVQPSPPRDRAGSSLTPAQREAHRRTGFDPGAW